MSRRRMCHRMTYTYVLSSKRYFLSGSSFLYILLVYSYFKMFFNAPTCSTSKIIANCESLVSGDTLFTTVVKISCSLGIPISWGGGGAFTCLLRGTYLINIFRTARYVEQNNGNKFPVTTFMYLYSNIGHGQ